MNWITQTFGSSVGKKLLMAVTGLGFIGFLTAHLAGNLSIYAGRDAFNNYALHLHSLGPLLTVFELGLLALAAVHVFTGLLLFYQNWQARPKRYQVYKSSGGRTIGSATMPYTGFLILLFVIFHLSNFSFVDKTTTTIFDIVAGSFQNPAYVAIYVAAMIVVALHVSHGFWSLFQTLGANHPKYMPIISGAGFVVSVVFGIGFGFIPLYITFMV
jgi:succinate dehydrogenase / fumarate reductase cytochrome b subunit